MESIFYNRDRKRLEVPASIRTIGVKGDHNVKRLKFELPKNIDAISIENSKIIGYWTDAAGVDHEAEVFDKTTEGDEVTFYLSVTNTMTYCAGDVVLFLCAQEIESGTVMKEWHSNQVFLKVDDCRSHLPSAVGSSEQTQINELKKELNDLKKEVLTFTPQEDEDNA